MKTNFLSKNGIIAAAILFLLSFNYSFREKYGIKTINLSMYVLAQSGSSGGDTGCIGDIEEQEVKYENCDGKFVKIYERSLWVCIGGGANRDCAIGTVIRDWDCSGEEIYCWDDIIVIKC